MASLADIRKSTIGSEQVHYYVEVPDDGITFPTGAEEEGSETVHFHRMLIRAESNAIDSGVTTEDPADVTSKVAGHEVTGYKKSLTHTGVYLTKDPVCLFENFIFNKEILDSRCTVRVLRFIEDGAAPYEAYMGYATCEVTQGVGGDAQSKAQISATYTYTSEEVEGTATFDKDTGIATWTPKAAG